MKLYDATFIICLVVVLSGAIVGYVSSKKLGDDNPVEEVAEEVIDATIQFETGIDPNIDLTPDSPEKK